MPRKARRPPVSVARANNAVHQVCNGVITAELIFVCLYRNWLQIFGFEDLLAVEAFHVIHTVTAGDDYRSLVLAGCLHTKRPEIRIILTRPGRVSRGLR